MHKLSGAFVLALVVATVSALGADLGTVVNQIDAMKKDLESSNGYLNSATTALFRMVATKEQIDKLDRDLAAASKIEDPKEKQAKLVAIQSEEAGVVEQATADKEVKKHQLSASQKEQLPKVLFNVLWAGLQDAKLAEDARALMPEARDALKSGTEKKTGGGLMGSLTKKGADDPRRAQRAINEDLPRIAEEASKNVKLSGGLAAGTRRLMAANKVPEGGAPTITSKPEAI